MGQNNHNPVDRIFAYICRYKKEHDGLSPSQGQIALSLALPTNQISAAIYVLETMGKIRRLGEGLTIPGGRWVPPGHDDLPTINRMAVEFARPGSGVTNVIPAVPAATEPKPPVPPETPPPGIDDSKEYEPPKTLEEAQRAARHFRAASLMHQADKERLIREVAELRKQLGMSDTPRTRYKRNRAALVQLPADLTG